MKKAEKKLERISDRLFTELTAEQVRFVVSAGSISVEECGTKLDFTQD